MKDTSGIIELVARAGGGFIAAKGKDPAVEGAPLAKWLLSDAEIKPGDRELLAELVTGQWRRSRRRSYGVGSERNQKILAFYHEREAHYGARQKYNAKSDTEDKFGINRTTLQTLLREERERKDAVKLGKQKMRKST